MQDLKRTALYSKHLELSAKMTEFGGWDMPLQYSGIKEEVAAVRQRAGMFDVSHMGEIRLKGARAGEFLDYILSRPVSHKTLELVNYAVLCYEDGGSVDDLMVYRFADDDYWLVVNASNKQKDFDFLCERAAEFDTDLELTDESIEYALIAVQGPEARKLADPAIFSVLLTDHEKQAELKEMKRFRRLVSADKDNQLIVISRTGYTGEDGYEIYLPVYRSEKLWDKLLEAGITPCGLGARDALRLEFGLPLYGHELTRDITPLEASLGRFVDLERDDYYAAKMPTPQRKSVALISNDRSIAREGYLVFAGDRQVGIVTSGSFSPTLSKGIALALIDKTCDAQELEIEIRGKHKAFSVTELPFIKK